MLKMTLINALETLKSKGITKLAGLSGESNIDKFIDNARHCDEDAQRWPEQGWAKYHVEHADDNFIVEIDGHYIIATHYDTHDMATYSNYDTEDEMHAAFEEWKIMQDAEKIADKMMISRPDELPRAAWILIAASELRAANKASKEAFEREFGKD
jgi:hypothetical protein